MQQTLFTSTHQMALHHNSGKTSRIGNYKAWKRSMEIALASKRKLGFVTGVITREKTDRVKQEAWDTCNNMVISRILGNDIWKSLEQRFLLSNGARNTKSVFKSMKPSNKGNK
ncbi:hypothetical protein RDABS01_034468 [Bienertia sinuspersici]